MNTSVKIGKIRLKNPVMVASGTFGAGEEYAEFIDINKLGAIVTKTITLRPRAGNPPPRIVETPAGMLNAIGLENKGLEYFLKEKIPFLRKLKIPVIVSISGETADEFKILAQRLGDSAIDGLELNISCPNIKSGKGLIAQCAGSTYDVVNAVRKATKLTIITKLSPNVTDITEIAQAAQDGGSDAVSLVNTFLGMAVDIAGRRHILGNVTGGLSGPAIKPLALRMVHEVYRKVKTPIIGIGGIINSKDALEFLICGAVAVQVGTANFIDPGAALGIADGIKKYLRDSKINDIKKITGSLKVGL